MSYRLPMKCRVIFAARMIGLGLGALAAMAAVLVGTSHSVAQQGAPKAQPKAKPKAAPAPTPTPQAQQGGHSDLLLLDQDLPEGAGGKCQAGLLPRQGRSLGVGHAGGRGGAG